MDPITDVLLIGALGTEILPSIISFFDSFAGLFGDEAATALIQGTAAIGQSDIRSALSSAIITDGGQVTMLNLPEFITAENKNVIINSVNTISKAMYEKGINLATQTGKDILSATWEKIKEYGPSLSSAALGTYVGQSIANYAQRHAEDLKEKIADKTSEIASNLGINN